MYRHPPQDPVQGQALPQRFLRRLGPQLLRPVVVLLLNTNLRLGLEDEEPQADLPFFNSQKPRMLPLQQRLRGRQGPTQEIDNDTEPVQIFISIPFYTGVSVYMPTIYLSV